MPAAAAGESLTLARLRLPDELVDDVMDYATLETLLSLRASCRQLRRLVENHATFWKDIEYHSPVQPQKAEHVEGPALLFRSRVASAGDRTISTLTVDVPETPPHAVVDLVVEALTAAWPLVSTATVFSTAALFAALQPVLHREAPNLKNLVLGEFFATDAALDFRRPDGLLGRSCGQLRVVSLYGIAWPAAAVPAFANVDQAVILVSSRPDILSVAPRHVFKACPNVRKLSVFGDDHEDPVPAQFWSGCARAPLDDVTLDVEGSSDGILGLTDASTRSVLVAGPTLDLVGFDSLFAQLDGELTMSVVARAPDCLVVGVRSDSRERATFWVTEEPYAQLYKLQPLAFLTVVDRVVELRVQRSTWRHVSNVSESFGSVRKLVIDLDERGNGHVARVAFPRLEVVSVYGCGTRDTVDDILSSGLWAPSAVKYEFHAPATVRGGAGEQSAPVWPCAREMLAHV